MSDATSTHPLIELRGISKFYGNIIALTGVSTTVNPGEVTCVLGDNGAGKSTFIKILAGVHQHDAGELLIEGNPVRFASPREALAQGIATVYQDLAMVPLMSVWRNFFLGAEPLKGFWPFRTHNPNHAYPVGDRFVILNRGHSMGNFAKADVSQGELTQMMSGGAELEALQHELATH